MGIGTDGRVKVLVTTTSPVETGSFRGRTTAKAPVAAARMRPAFMLDSDGSQSTTRSNSSDTQLTGKCSRRHREQEWKAGEGGRHMEREKEVFVLAVDAILDAMA